MQFPMHVLERTRTVPEMYAFDGDIMRVGTEQVNGEETREREKAAGLLMAS